MKLDHTGIEVEDIYKMELFYKKIFGFKTIYRYVSKNSLGLKTVFIEKDGLRLELLQRPRDYSLSDFKKNPSFHISIEVNDVDREYKRLKEFDDLNIKCPRDTGDGFREMELKDTEGNIIEISKRIKPFPWYSIKGIIFDLDGTLINSEENYFEADRILLDSYGIKFSEKEKEKFIGQSNIQMMKEFKELYGIKDSIETMVEKKNQIYLELAFDNTPIYPEMFKFLIKLKKMNYPVAIASGSSPVILDKLLKKLDLKKYFDVIVSAETVEKGKPAPDVFLKASQLLGIEPQNLVVIEDSKYGVEAAKRAFMYCIAVPYIIKKPLSSEFLMADLIFKNGMKQFNVNKAIKWIKKCR